MPPGFGRLFCGWVVLLMLWGCEFATSFIEMPPALRPVLLIVAAAMVALVGFLFMHVSRGPTVARGFAVMAIFWIIVLVGLGSMDPLTRTQYFTATYQPQ